MEVRTGFQCFEPLSILPFRLEVAEKCNQDEEACGLDTKNRSSVHTEEIKESRNDDRQGSQISDDEIRLIEIFVKCMNLIVFRFQLVIYDDDQLPTFVFLFCRPDTHSFLIPRENKKEAQFDKRLNPQFFDQLVQKEVA